MKRLLASCFLLSACGVVGPSGQLLGAPVGVTTALDPAIRVKLPGFVPMGLWDVDPPAFRQFPDDILRFAAIELPPDSSPILAMSLGLEVILVSQLDLTASDQLDGVPAPDGLPVTMLQAGTHGWTAMGFTVNSDEIGGSPVSPAIQDAIWLGELDRTVFGYMLPDSTAEVLPVEMESTRLMAPDAIGLDDPTDAIHGLDMHMALYHTDMTAFTNVFTTRALPPGTWLYFTLRPDFLKPAVATAIAQGWNLPLADVTSGSIFATQWSGSSWTQPILYRTWQQLGITTSIDTATAPVIDGLAMDIAVGGQFSEADEILFSLAPSPDFRSDPDHQVQYFAGNMDPSKPARRVVVRKRIGGYGSLGRQLGVGRGLGDFCNADPSGQPRYQVLPCVLDDFFVARRLDPTRPPMPAAAVAAANTAYATELGLAISAWRHVDASAGHRGVGMDAGAWVRTSMSWPEPKAWGGNAYVRWGLMQDVMKNPQAPGNIVWLGSQRLPYAGQPLTYDIKLPPGGLLGPNPVSPGAPSTRACVVQWLLRTGGERWRSPIAALRF